MTKEISIPKYKDSYRPDDNLPVKVSIDQSLIELADLIIDTFLTVQKRHNSNTNGIFNTSSDYFRSFNGRLGQDRKALSSPRRPLKLYERYNRNQI